LFRRRVCSFSLAKEPSGDEHFVPNKVKANEARHFSGRPVFEVAVHRILDHLPKLFNALRLRENRMPGARGPERPVYFLFTGFKDDPLHTGAV
jgi:hypothetical protein